MRVGSVRALRVLLFIAVSSLAGLAFPQPVVIDGEFDPAEWSGATLDSFSVNVPGGGTTPGELYLKNDSANLYVALRYQRSALDIPSAMELYADSPAVDGTPGGYGDDGFGVTTGSGCPIVKLFYDEFVSFGKTCPICLFKDSDFGGTTDGNGAVGNDGVWTTYEMWHPLASADSAHDIQVGPGQKLIFNVAIDVNTVYTSTPVYAYLIH